MSLIYTAIVCISVMILPGLSLANKPQTAAEKAIFNSLKKEGFDNVHKFLDSMTPEQRQRIIQGAKNKQHQVNLTPAEIKELKQQLLEIERGLNINEVDRSKLDEAIEKGLKNLPQEIEKYRT